MPDQLADRARKAAEEIAREFLAEPCREVDDDGKICAWKYDDADVEKIAAVIERNVGGAWIAVDERKPPKVRHVLAVCWRKNDWNDKISRMVVVAEYIPERTVLAEDYLDGDAEYDDEGWETDENGNAFVPESWYERAWFNSDYSGWLLDAKVTHWMPIPEMPERKEDAPCPEK